MTGYDILAAVNRRINALPYVSDAEKYGQPEFWASITDAGDCEDFAIAKYRALIEGGMPATALRLATCYVETGEYHAVLLADVAGETWVLDNRHPHPMRYADLPYKWDRLQIAGTGKWEAA